MRWILFLSLFAALVSPLYAITDEEIFRAFNLNLSTPGARAVAMGGAFIGRADDATATQTNPAGLTILARPEVSLEYNHVSERRVRTEVLNIPIRNLDGTPTVPDSGTLFGRSDFRADDNLRTTDSLGFASVVFPVGPVTLGFSRHVLIDTEVSLFGAATASPFHFLENNSFQGTSDIENVNYGISIASRVGDHLSVGATVKLSDFSIRSDVAAQQKDQDFGEHFIASYQRDDQRLGFNVGVLIHATPTFSAGVVYRYEPEFDIDSLVRNVDFAGGTTTANVVKFDVPDSLGIGFSMTPMDSLTVNLDIVRVFYSQLEDVNAGFSLFTHLLPFPKDQLQFRVSDGTDLHVGAEYLVLQPSYVFAFRGGYYSQSSNRFYFVSAPAAGEFLAPIYGTQSADAINHITVGSGFTYRSFQLDVAVDIALENELVDRKTLVSRQEKVDGGVQVLVSSVFRF